MWVPPQLSSPVSQQCLGSNGISLPWHGSCGKRTTYLHKCCATSSSNYHLSYLRGGSIQHYFALALDAAAAAGCPGGGENALAIGGIQSFGASGIGSLGEAMNRRSRMRFL